MISIFLHPFHTPCQVRRSTGSLMRCSGSVSVHCLFGGHLKGEGQCVCMCDICVSVSLVGKWVTKCKQCGSWAPRTLGPWSFHAPQISLRCVACGLQYSWGLRMAWFSRIHLCLLLAPRWRYCSFPPTFHVKDTNILHLSLSHTCVSHTQIHTHTPQEDR